MSRAPVETSLRQMIAVLEEERQALAGLDLDGLLAASRDKLALCGAIEATTPITLDEATRDLAETARRLNEVNRRVRNLLAANVAARIDALSGGAPTYRLAQAAAR
jgi:hypothetical protein